MTPYRSIMEIIDVHTHHPASGNHVIINAGTQAIPPDADGYYSIGVHPWYSDRDINLPQLEMAASDPRVLAIGETGLDMVKGPSIEQQQQLFAWHIALSERLRKPLILHVVREWDMVLEMFDRVHHSQSWIAHGFRGKPGLAAQLAARGIYMSIGERFNPQSLVEIPSNLILSETDESILDIETIVQAIATTRGVAVEEMRRVIVGNSSRIFGRHVPISPIDRAQPPTGEQ